MLTRCGFISDLLCSKSKSLCNPSQKPSDVPSAGDNRRSVSAVTERKP